MTNRRDARLLADLRDAMRLLSPDMTPDFIATADPMLAASLRRAADNPTAIIIPRRADRTIRRSHRHSTPHRALR